MQSRAIVHPPCARRGVATVLILATACLGFLMSAGDASADAPRDPTPRVGAMQPVSPVTNTTSITGRNGTVLPSAPKTGVATAQGKVEGGSTGQGHLSEKDCDEIAGFINEHNDWADRFIAEGEVGSALYQLGEAEDWENIGLSGGCFFTNVPV